MLKNRRLNKYLFSIIGVAWALQPEAIIACTCGNAWYQYMNNADSVFTGRVIAKKISTNSPSSLSPGPLSATFVPDEKVIQWTFLVEDNLKGTTSPEVTVESNSNSSSCGSLFEMGKRYQVFANYRGTTLRTSSCSGTAQLCPNEEQLSEPHTTSLKDINTADIFSLTPEKRFEAMCARRRRYRIEQDLKFLSTYSRNLGTSCINLGTPDRRIVDQ